jgi:hypothetical protein
MALDVSALKEQAKYSLDGFIPVPMKIGKCGPEIQLETEMGVKRLLVDTGAGRSVLRGKGKDKDLRFWTDEHDLGALKVCFFELTDRFEVDGILGMDFFLKHRVCIDFPGSMVYISPVDSKF